MSEHTEAKPPSELKAESVQDSILRIASIQDLTVKEVQTADFIAQRLGELSAQTSPTELSILSRPYSQFIHPETEVKQTFILEGVKVNDPEIYKTLLKTIDQFKNLPGWEEKPLGAIALYAVQWTIGMYFGRFMGADMEANTGLMWERTMSDGPFSLADFKDKGLAVCTQKAAAAQNLLKFLDVDSTMIFTPETEIDGKIEPHAYNVIKTKSGKNYIFDPTNPSWVSDSVGNVINYEPALYEINREQAAGLLSGGAVEVEHRNFSQDHSVAEIDKRVYSGPQTVLAPA